MTGRVFEGIGAYTDAIGKDVAMFAVYQAKLEKAEEGGYIITFPDVAGAVTQGETKEEALENAPQALGLALRAYYMCGKALPQPLNHKGREFVPVAVDAWNALKLAVAEVFGQTGITKTELACRIGKSETEARRILDLNYPTKLQLLEQALAVMGKQVIISISNRPGAAARLH